MGGMFFRMARDNDDIVRASLILAAGSLLTVFLATTRLKLPVTLALPCLGWALAVFLSSFVTVNVAESLKEFLKIGVYLLLLLTLASAATQPVGMSSRTLRFTIPGVLLILGVILGFGHSHGLFGIEKFKLWTDSQVIASLATVGLLGAAFTLSLGSSTVRQAVLRGLAIMALIACTLAVLQFYHLDPLRPWDPRQPYNIYIRGWSADVLTFLASVTKGQLQMEGDGLVLVLPRILSIYGNPDFFAPYLLQFIPIAVAVTVLDPARRTAGAIMTALLLFTLFLTAVWGAFFSLIVLAPLFIALLGFVSGRLTQPKAIRLAASTLAAGAVLLCLLTWLLHASGRKSHAIEERLFKYRMAAEMWERSPLIGIGLNAYKSWYPRIQQEVRLQHDLPFEALGSSFTQENRTHNDLFQMVAETGVLGTGLFLWLMATILYGALRYLKRLETIPARERANVCGLMGGVLVILIYALPNFPFHIVSSAATFWIMAGLLASYMIPAVPEGPSVPRATSPALSEAGALAGRVEGSWAPEGLKRALLVASGGTFLVTLIFVRHLILGTLEYKRANPNPQQQRIPLDTKKAAAKYERALDLDFSNAQYAYDYGAMCFNLSNTDPTMKPRAERLLKKALRLGFMNEDLVYGLGHLAEQEGRFDEALTWYTQATALNERHEPSRQGRLRIMLKELNDPEQALGKKQYARARELYATALARNPKNHLAAYKLGTLSVTPFGDVESGIRHLDAAARAAVNEPSFYLALGRAQAAGKHLDEARRALTRAAVLDPKSAEIKAALSQLEQLRTQSTSPPL